jgi:hypothetical protein
MPRIVLTTDYSPREALDLVEKVARKQKFTVEEDDEGLRIRRGTIIGGLLLGEVFTYVNLLVLVGAVSKRETEVTFEWSTTWWTGPWGAWRTGDLIKTFVDEIQGRIEVAGGEVFDRDNNA